MKLLIVDDSNIMRRAIEKYVKPFSLDIVGTASDGEMAVAMFRQHMPDLVTLDITMPRMDGLACLDEIMKMKPSTRVLVISALKDPATGLQALRKGARGFLPKPFTEAELQEEIRILVSAAKGALV